MAGTITPAVTRHRSRGVVRADVAITTDASGDATVTSIGSFYGRLVGLLYEAGDLATGVDITIVDVATGAVVFTLTDAGTSPLFILPGINRSALTKAVLTSGTSNTDAFKDVYVAGELSLVAAQGGNAKSGSVALIIDEG